MRTVALLVVVMLSACRSYEWHPQKLRFVDVPPVGTRAVEMFEGDLNQLMDCPERVWLGDVVCKPSCGDIREWAAEHGATHVWLVETYHPEPKAGRPIPSSQDYRLFYVRPRLQLSCLTRELQSQ